MVDNQDDSFNASKAEVFEALGHPTRIRILQELSEKPLPFSELKRAAGLDSNGLLTFHLGKLGGLVSLNPDGAYALTDEGREALRIVEASKSQIHERPFQRPSIRAPHLNTILAGLVVVLIILASASAIEYNQIQGLDSRIQSDQTSTVTVTTTTGLIQPCSDQVWSANSSSTNADIPVLLMQPESTAFICVTYQSAWRGNPSTYQNLSLVFQSYQFGLSISREQCVTSGGGTACTQNISHSFIISAIPSSIELSGTTDYVTVIYTVNSLSGSTGFYDNSAPYEYCGAMPMAVGYAATQVNASDFPDYTFPASIPCAFSAFTPASVSVGGMNATYIAF